MLDTLEVARSLTDVDFTPAQADAITKAVRRAAEHGDHVTPDQLAAALAEVRAEMRTEFAAVRTEMRTGFAEVRTEMQTGFAEIRAEMRTEFAAVRTEFAAVQGDLRAGIASLEARLVRWVVGTAVVLVGAVAALLRLWPSG